MTVSVLFRWDCVGPGADQGTVVGVFSRKETATREMVRLRREVEPPPPDAELGPDWDPEPIPIFSLEEYEVIET